MRKSLVQIHLWLGLAIGLLWALQGLTGALLVFHRDIDRWAGPSLVSGPMASLDRVASEAKARVDGPIQMIGIADESGALLNVHFKDGTTVRQLRMEAATAKIVDVRDYDPKTPLRGSGWRWIYLLHESLLLHDRGERIVGISGMFLLSALLTGIVIGWPKRQQVKAIFSWRRWKTIRAKLFGWHRMLGLLAGFVLLITVPGGLWMIFAADVRPAIATVLPHELPYKAAPIPEFGKIIEPQDAVDRARTHFPDAAFVRLTLPTPTTPVYAVRLRQQDEIRAWSGVTTVTVDARTGRTLHVYDPLNAPLTNRLADAAFSVHSGEIAGLFGRMLLMLAGFALPVLYATGVWAWLRRRGAQSQRQSRDRPLAVLNAKG